MAAEPKLSEEHSTVYHYTTMAAFRSIWQTQELWARHFRYMNDASETERLGAKMFDAIRPAIKKAAQTVYHKGGKDKVVAAGGASKLADDCASDLIEKLYSLAFGDAPDNRGNYAQPYLASFCVHTDDGEYTRDNGLLSMWRGYGTDGGVAVCFSALGMEEALTEEHGAHWYPRLIWDDVVYEGDDARFHERFETFLNRYRDAVIETITGTGEQDFRWLFEEFVRAACTYKHQAFREEQEVRVVALVGTPELLQEKLDKEKWDAVTESRPFKPINEQYPNGQRVPHIRLFEGANRRLPVERIIVGPHADQGERVKDIEQLVDGFDIKVRASETPYIPPTT